jgi:long-chain acyl-CoA synthetase
MRFQDLTVADALRKSSDRGCSPDEVALVDARRTWTYGHLAEVIDDIQSWLLYLGVRPGDRVMIVSDQCHALVAILFALARLDAWPVLVDASLSAREVDHVRNQCCPRRILYMTNASEEAQEHATRHHAVTADAVDWGPIAFGALNEGSKPTAFSRDRAAA